MLGAPRGKPCSPELRHPTSGGSAAGTEASEQALTAERDHPGGGPPSLWPASRNPQPPIERDEPVPIGVRDRPRRRPAKLVHREVSLLRRCMVSRQSRG